MQEILLLLQVASIGLTVYVLLQVKKIFREVRSPVIRQKNQLPGDFKDRLRTLPRPDGQSRENRGDRPQGNREDRPREDRPRGDRPREDRPRSDRPRDDRPREDRPRDDRPRSDRPRDDRPRDDRPRSDRPRDDRPRDDRPRSDRPRDDRPREPRPESAPVATESAPVVATEGAPAFSGRRPLPNANTPAQSYSAPVADALAPASFAQPVAEAPRSFGRRQVPKAKPRFDDDAESGSEEKTETASV